MQYITPPYFPGCLLHLFSPAPHLSRRRHLLMLEPNPSVSIARSNGGVLDRPSLAHKMSSGVSQLKIPVTDIPEHIPGASYPVTRNYRMHSWWRQVYLALYVGGILAIGALIAVAYATQGYEPQAKLTSDYNATQHFWYDAFSSRLSSRRICDPHVFSVGDTFQTSQGAFNWNIDSLLSEDPNPLLMNTQGIDYIGRPLLPGMCALTGIKVAADLPALTVTTLATIQCQVGGSFPVNASTSFVSSPSPEKASLDETRFVSPILQYANVEDQNKWAAQVLLEISGMDLITTLQMMVNPLATSVNSLYVSWTLKSPVPLCYTKPFFPDFLSVGFSNGTLLSSEATSELILNTYWNTTSNVLQTMMAAANLDIGSPCPTFMTEPSMIPDMLYQTPTLLDNTSYNYYQTPLTPERTFMNTLQRPNGYLDDLYGFTFPLYSGDYVYVNAAYLCHFSQRKSFIALMVAIISATYGLFKSGWGAAMFVVLSFAPKPLYPNYCDGHVVLEEQIRSLLSSPINVRRGTETSEYSPPMATLAHCGPDVKMPSLPDDAGATV